MFNMPFNILGYDHGNYYFIAHSDHKITILTTEELNKKNILKLAPISWWKKEYNGIPVDKIIDDLLRACHSRGGFNHVEFFQNELRYQRKMGWFK